MEAAEFKLWWDLDALEVHKVSYSVVWSAIGVSLIHDDGSSHKSRIHSQFQ